MPTIEIRAGKLSVSARRAIAIRLTRWLSAQGVSPAHVVVRFAETTPGDMFIGGMPADALDRDSAGVSPAITVCRISPERGEDFRADLAEEIVNALKSRLSLSFVYVEFWPTRSDHVYVGRSAGLMRADTSTQTDTTGDST